MEREREKGGKTDRQTARQTDRQTDRKERERGKGEKIVNKPKFGGTEVELDRERKKSQKKNDGGRKK